MVNIIIFDPWLQGNGVALILYLGIRDCCVRVVLLVEVPYLFRDRFLDDVVS